MVDWWSCESLNNLFFLASRFFAYLQILVFNQKYGAMPELNEALSYREEYEKLQSKAEK